MLATLHGQPILQSGADRLPGLAGLCDEFWSRICNMAQKDSTPQLTSREYKDGRGWYVEATGEGRVAENVGDFASDSEAKDWIARKSIAYFKSRQK